jgi:Spy/CpxP family protein refolding chaperone
MKKFGKVKLLAIASLSAVVLAASIAVAQSVKTEGQGQDGKAARRGWHGQGMKRRGGHRGGDRLFSRLNLTEDQKTKMKQIRQSSAERNKPLREQLRAKRQELRQASEGGTFNEALATQKLTESAALQAKLMGERFKIHQEMLSVLTAEQKAQLDQMKAQFKDRRGKRRGLGEPRENK